MVWTRLGKGDFEMATSSSNIGVQFLHVRDLGEGMGFAHGSRGIKLVPLVLACVTFGSVKERHFSPVAA